MSVLYTGTYPSKLTGIAFHWALRGGRPNHIYVSRWMMPSRVSTNTHPPTPIYYSFIALDGPPSFPNPLQSIVLVFTNRKFLQFAQVYIGTVSNNEPIIITHSNLSITSAMCFSCLSNKRWQKLENFTCDWPPGSCFLHFASKDWLVWTFD